MPHVELELTEDVRPYPNGQRAARPGAPTMPRSSLARWAAAVTGASEPSLVLRADSVIVAASATCAELICLGDPADATGQPLRDAVANLVDFTESLAELDHAEADKIPPLLAISSGRLARGLMRVLSPADGTTCTMDAIATPLWDDRTLVGSLTFFSRI